MGAIAPLVKAALATTALLIIAFSGHAAARTLSISNSSIRASFEEIELGPQSGGLSASCPVTLEGTLHSRTLAKVAGLVGYITRAAIDQAECSLEIIESIVFLNSTERLLTGGGAPNSLPWHVRYESFTGTLPNISEINLRVIGLAYLFLFVGISCLYASTVAAPARFILTILNRIMWTINPNANVRIPRSPGSSQFCPESTHLEGIADVTLAGTSSTSITVTLI